MPKEAPRPPPPDLKPEYKANKAARRERYVQAATDDPQVYVRKTKPSNIMQTMEQLKKKAEWHDWKAMKAAHNNKPASQQYHETKAVVADVQRQVAAKDWPVF
jgi:hypothetical protein